MALTKHYLSDHIPTDIPDGGMYCFELEGRPLLYLRQGGEDYVTQRMCPHASVDLSTGYFAGHVIICPKHHYKFDVRTGRHISGEDYRLRIYPIEHDDQGRYIYE